MIEVDSARRSFNLGKSHLLYFSMYVIKRAVFKMNTQRTNICFLFYITA